MFQCLSKTQCIERRYHCDEHTDCNDGSDEDSCSKYSEEKCRILTILTQDNLNNCQTGIKNWSV